MNASLMYFDGCPNWQKTRDLLREALDEVGLFDTGIMLRRVDNPEQAERWDFHGSPTVLMDGEDPFTTPSTGVGLTCRVYQTGSGLTGSPTREQLVQALRARI